MGKLREDLRAITADGAAASVMVGIGETYLPAFVLVLSASQVASGLVATVPMLLGAVLQLVSPYVVRGLRSYRRWVVLCAVVQAVAFVPLIHAALAGSMPTLVVFAIASVYWGTGQAGGSSWNTWVGSLVPGRFRNRYFARRTLVSQSGLLAGFILGGVTLQIGSSLGEPLLPFALLFLVAAVSRLVSAQFLSRQSEPTRPGSELISLSPARLLSHIQHNRIGKVLLYMLAVQTSVQIAGPYFTPYMLRHLKFSYTDYMVLICAAYVAKILVLSLIGRLADHWGAKRLLWIGGLAISPVSALWLVSNSFGFLLGLQILSGIAWAGYELAMLLLFFESIPSQQRVAILTVFNLANAAAVVLGSLLGGAYLAAMAATPGAYLALFVVSGVARLAALILLVRVPQAVVRPFTLATGAAALRPSMGSIERPILPSGKPLPSVPHWLDRAVAQRGTSLRDVGITARSEAPRSDFTSHSEVPHSETKSLSQNRRGLVHFAESSEQNVPVPSSAQGLRIGSKWFAWWHSDSPACWDLRRAVIARAPCPMVACWLLPRPARSSCSHPTATAPRIA
ncbi:MAG: MFS transporter [Pirellulales bacterium]|nr:MFS transporter [Pirellulales bacterium]